MINDKIFGALYNMNSEFENIPMFFEKCLEKNYGYCILKYFGVSYRKGQRMAYYRGILNEGVPKRVIFWNIFLCIR